MYSKTIIIGNISKDIQLTYISTGTALAKTSIAYDDGFGDKKKTHFIDISVWGKTAEALNRFCKKGSKIMCEGIVELQTWTAQDGSSRSRHSLRVDEMKMLDGKPSEGQSSYQAPTQPKREPQIVYEQSIPEFDIDESEIPF